MAEFKKQKDGINFAEQGEGCCIHRRITGLHTETGADFILPDYMGDVKKLLNFSAKVTPSGKFHSGNTLSLSGIVEYSIIYLDSEMRLTEAHFTSDYDYDVKVEEGYLSSFEKCRISSPSVRLAGPRKICAKATVLSELFVGEIRSIPLAPDDDTVEVKTKEIKIHRGEYTDFIEREFAEEAARLEGAHAEDVQVVFCGGDVKFNGSKAQGGTLELEGELKLYAVLCISEESHIRVEKSIGFSQMLEVSDDEGDVLPEGYISSLRVNINPVDGEEDMLSVTFSAIASLGARVDKNVTIALPKDAYSRCSGSECCYEDYKYTEFIDSRILKSGLNFEFKKSELEEAEIADVIHTDSSVKLTESKISDGVLSLEGAICFSVIVKVGAEGNFASLKLERPFEINERIPCPASVRAEAIVYPKISDLSVTLDSSSLFIKCDLTTPLLVFAAEEESYLAGMRFYESEESEEACVIKVYYPEESDTLWSVAKKYRIPMEKILEHNDISASASTDGDVSLAGGEVLLIIKD